MALVPVLNLSFTIAHLSFAPSSYAFREYKWFSPNDDLSLVRGQLFGCFVGWLVDWFPVYFMTTASTHVYDFITNCDQEGCKFEQIQAIYGDRGSTVVKVLCYKSDGRLFDPR